MKVYNPIKTYGGLSQVGALLYFSLMGQLQAEDANKSGRQIHVQKKQSLSSIIQRVMSIPGAELETDNVGNPTYHLSFKLDGGEKLSDAKGRHVKDILVLDSGGKGLTRDDSLYLMVQAMADGKPKIYQLHYVQTGKDDYKAFIVDQAEGLKGADEVPLAKHQANFWLQQTAKLLGMHGEPDEDAGQPKPKSNPKMRKPGKKQREPGNDKLKRGFPKDPKQIGPPLRIRNASKETPYHRMHFSG